MSREIKEISINEFENEFKTSEGKTVSIDVRGSISFLKIVNDFDIWQDENKIALCDCNDESEVGIQKQDIVCIVQDERISSIKTANIFLRNGLEINLQEDVDNE